MLGATIVLVGIIFCILLDASWNRFGIRFATPSAWVASIVVAHVQIKATLVRLEKLLLASPDSREWSVFL